MERMLLTPYEFAKTVFESGHKGLAKVYPDMLFSAEQQLQLTQFVVDSGEVRQVVKIEKAFSVVKGRYKEDQHIAPDSIIQLPAGHYVTESKALIGRIAHTYIYGMDEEAYTVVNDIPRTEFRDGMVFKNRIVLSQISVETRQLREVLLFGPDIDRYLVKTGEDSQSNKHYVSKVTSISKKHKATMDDLIEVTGASNQDDAIAVAVWLIQQTERENERLDKSAVLAQFISTLIQCEKGTLRFDTLNQTEKYLQETFGFTTRQANVFGQEIMKQMPDL